MAYPRPPVGRTRRGEISALLSVEIIVFGEDFHIASLLFSSASRGGVRRN
jgi:hypothetical protein